MEDARQLSRWAGAAPSLNARRGIDQALRRWNDPVAKAKGAAPGGWARRAPSP